MLKPENSDFTEHLIGERPLDEAILWIADRLPPEDVFDAAVLAAWAMAHGFVKVTS